jgi:hypothetical protein
MRLQLVSGLACLQVPLDITQPATLPGEWTLPEYIVLVLVWQYIFAVTRDY